MTGFTRRPTGFSNPADYVFMYRGKDVGRCYRGLFGMSGQKWLWTIYSPIKDCGVPDKGHEETLEAAQEAFKSSYLKMFEIE